MELKDLKNKLKKCQPYFTEKDLINKLYFSEETNGDGQNIERWIFFYAFIRKLSDNAIAIRLGFLAKQTVNKRIKKIINENKFLIEEFLSNYSQNVDKI